MNDRNLKERADMAERRSLRWRTGRAADAGGAHRDSLALEGDDADSFSLDRFHKGVVKLISRLTFWVIRNAAATVLKGSN